MSLATSEKSTIYHVLDKKKAPVFLFQNHKTAIQVALIGQPEGEKQSPCAATSVIIKSTPGPESPDFSLIDSTKATNDLLTEENFYLSLGWACPYIVEFFDQTTFLNPETCKSDPGETVLVIKRVEPLTRTLNFIHAQGLPSLLSVAKGMSRCISYIHRHGLAHNDVKLDNFGIDYEVEESTYSDGTLHDKTVKGLDFGTLQKRQVRQSLDFLGSAYYIPKYRGAMEISARGLIKADLFGLALSLYDLITNRQRIKNRVEPSDLTPWALFDYIMANNHQVRFTPEDLLFLFPAPPAAEAVYSEEQLAEAKELSVRLNHVLARALTKTEAEGYQAVDELYTDFICSFETLLSEEQLARLFN